MTDAVRISAARVVLAVGLMSGLLISRPLWWGETFFPAVPLTGFLGTVGAAVEGPLYWLALGLCLAVAAGVWARTGSAALAAILVFLAAADQVRLQPWPYMYLLGLLALAAAGDGAAQRRRGLCTLRFMIASIYFWSGIHKVHAGFFTDVHPWMVGPLTEVLPAFAAEWLVSGGVLAPFLEAGFGVALLFPRTRNAAALGAAGMHVFILAMLGPLGLGWNAVVWPWNLAMIALLFILFRQTPEVGPAQVLRNPGSRYHVVVVTLLGVLPAMTLVNRWDAYLSMALYAPQRYELLVKVPAGLLERLPSVVRNELWLQSDEQGRPEYFLAPAPWAAAELGVVPPPERRIVLSIARYLCREARGDPAMVGAIYGPRNWLSNARDQQVFNCASLPNLR